MSGMKGCGFKTLYAGALQEQLGHAFFQSAPGIKARGDKILRTVCDFHEPTVMS